MTKGNAKRKLIPALAMLVVAAVTLTSASYAWFTMSRNVSADGIQLTATAPTNLLIASGAVSADDTTGKWDGTVPGLYDSKTTVAMINEGEASVINVGKLKPVSSLDGLNFFAPKTMTAANGAPTAQTEWYTNADTAELKAVNGTADGYYIDVPLWLKSTGSEDITVGLDLDNTSITDKAGKPLYKAVRVALLNEDGTVAVTDGQTAPVDKYQFHTATDWAAEWVGKDIVGPIKEVAAPETDYKGVSDADQYATGTEKLFSMAAPDRSKDETETVKKIVVRIWIEGQDGRCVTANAGQSFQVALGFQVITPADSTATSTTTPIAP